MARRILFEGKVATGVEYAIGRETRRAFARHEIVLSAGAIRSPQILMLSGVGPEQELRRNGINVIHDLPGVGANYMDHHAVALTYAVQSPTWNRYMSAGQKALQGLRWLLLKQGPANSGASQAVGFVHSDRALPRPDLQLTLLPIGPDPDADRSRRLRDVIMIYVDECRPTARGLLTLTSNRIDDLPAISHPGISSQSALGAVTAGVRTTRRIMATKVMKSLVEAELAPTISLQTDDEIASWAQSVAKSMAHASGTCRMGRDRAAVVDQELRVHGIAGLRIADASIMPSITSGNINAPTIMIGERAADFILSSLNSSAGTAQIPCV